MRMTIRKKTRGTSMLVPLFLIPASAMLLLLLLTRLDVGYADAQRNQLRVQARLLAESALAVLEQEGLPAATEPITRTLEGMGSYTIQPEAAPAGDRRVVRLIGEARGRDGRFLCEIRAESGPGRAAPRLLAITQHIAPK